MAVRESIDPKASLWAWLAFDLWFHRTQRGLSLAQVAQIVRVTRGTVSNWEAGRLRPKEDQLKALDQAWVTGGHFERLMFYARTGHDPDWYKQFTQYESGASEIKIYHGKAIPPLVQTPAYAQSLLWAAGRTREADAEIRARMKRQEILSRDEPPHLWILIDQEILECPAGGGDVMRGQLRRLLEIGEPHRVSIRVVPRSAGPHPGHDGPFQIFTIMNREVAYAGAQIGGRLIESSDEVRTLGVRFAQIGTLALPRDASRAFIDRTLGRYR